MTDYDIYIEGYDRMLYWQTINAPDKDTAIRQTVETLDELDVQSAFEMENASFELVGVSAYPSSYRKKVTAVKQEGKDEFEYEIQEPL